MESLMIDMDDVIVRGGFLYLINEYLGTSYIEEDIKGYYMQDMIPEEAKADFWNWFFSGKNMYDHCEMLPNAYEVIEELNKVYKICISTAYIFPERPRESGKVLIQKFNYLMDNLPFLTPQNYAFIMDKSLINCKIKIDDRIDNLAIAERKLMFTAYHNKDIENKFLQQRGVDRANDWLDVKKILLKK